MGDRAALRQLLHELKLARTPLGRVKLLSRGWRVLRRLDRDELQELAAESGLEQAEGLLEKLAHGRGKLTPGLVLPLLERLRGVEAHRVRDVVRALRDPQQRDEFLRGGLDALEGWLEGDEAAPPADELSQETPSSGSPAEVPPPRSMPPEPESIPVATEMPIASPPNEAAPVGVVEQPSAARPRSATVAVPVAAEPRPANRPRPPDASRPGTEIAGREEPAVGLPEVEELVAGLEAEAMPVRRLRMLRMELEHLRGADPHALERVLECFPAGWSRRRALTALLRAGIPASLMHAVFLIEQLPSSASRRWCAGTLLDHRRLEPDERDALAERHGVFRARRAAR